MNTGELLWSLALTLFILSAIAIPIAVLSISVAIIEANLVLGVFGVVCGVVSLTSFYYLYQWFTYGL